MPALSPDAVRPGLRLFSRWALSPRVDWPTRRRRLDLGLSTPGAVRGTTCTARTVGGVPAEEQRPADASSGRTILYLHGGGYCVGSLAAYRRLTTTLAAATKATVIALDYRLAPEHVFPAQRDDALAAWSALSQDVDPQRLVVAGDSAGAGLTLTLALALRDAGRPLPGALGLICPWVDHRPQRHPPAARDPVLTNGVINAFAHGFLGDADPASPDVSPLFADLGGLPPAIVQTGTDDLLTPTDGLPLVDALRRAGVAVEHQSLQDAWHDPHLSSHLLGTTPFERFAAGLDTTFA